jgi:hypothetical protein
MTSKLQQDELEACVVPVRLAVLAVGVEDNDLPGFIQPSGLTGVFTIYLAGIKRTSAEEAANGIAEMVRRTSLTSLKPITVQMIGALIRAIGERHPSAGKTAILHALATLLDKAPQFAKPFIPQLQRTAVKNLSDFANSDVRNEAAVVLGALIPMQPRVDPLVTELVGAANSSVDDAVKLSIVKALCEVFSRAGKLVGEPQKAAVCDLIRQILKDGRGTEISSLNLQIGQIIAMAVRLMSLVLKFLSTGSAIAFIRSEIIDVELSRTSVIALNGFLHDPPASLLNIEILDEISDLSLKAAVSTDVNTQINACSYQDFISEAGILATGKIMTNPSIEKDGHLTQSIFNILNGIIRQPPSGSTDSQRLSLVVVRTISRKDYEVLNLKVKVYISLSDPIYELF